MTLFFLGGGKRYSFPDIVDFLDYHESEGFGFAGLLGDLWRQGLVSVTDRFAYGCEVVDSHVNERLEVWSSHPRSSKKVGQLILTLHAKHSVFGPRCQLSVESGKLFLRPIVKAEERSVPLQ